MASRINLPRIVKDIQDIIKQLHDEFTATGDPITDDSHILHRLCMKLEYLLQSCMREKTLLGGTKSYWRWMYDCLKRQRGLSDGLKFVWANREVRTSQGRGRALIRYSLVHQTLADSFQNCLMNSATCLQYLKPTCVLMNRITAEAFVNALYDLNAVNFDLTSKGYDLESAWPTFASKRYPSSSDQWRPPARSTSLGSLNSLTSHVTNTSIMMDNPSLRGLRPVAGSFVASNGPGSSGPPSVDQRVEELVLELNQSDQKIQEQQEAFNRLQWQAENMVKSAGEKQDILARVISDLESRNQSLQEAMSQMSTEFQNREQQWSGKHSDVSKQLEEVEANNRSLKNKILLLEEDKRNLEDTVSARMSRITSGFSGTNDMNFSNTEKWAELETAKRERSELEKQVTGLRLELVSMPAKIANEKEALRASLTAEFESKKGELRRKMDSASADVTNNLILKMSTILPSHINQSMLKYDRPQDQIDFILSQLGEIMNECSHLRRTSSELEQEKLLQLSYDKELEFKSSELLEEFNKVKLQKDDALIELREMSEKLVRGEKELQSYKLKLEAALSEKQHSAVELRDENFQLQQQVGQQRKEKEQAMNEVKFLEEKCDSLESDLKSLKQRCSRLQDELENHERRVSEFRTGLATSVEEQERLATALKHAKDEKQSLENLLSGKENALGEAESLVQELNTALSQLQLDLTSSDSEKQQLENSIVELKLELETREKGFLVKSKEIQEERSCYEEKIKDSESLLQLYRQNIEELERRNQSMNLELNLEKSRAVEKIQQNSDEFSEVVDGLKMELKRANEGLEGAQLKATQLEETVAEKEKAITALSTQLSADKLQMEEEMQKQKKEFEELNGENESRKRMIKNFEKKIEALEKEKLELGRKASRTEELEEKLERTERHRDELLESSRIDEQELVNSAQKLEAERELSQKLEEKIEEGLHREQEKQKENEDVSNELKAKLIQLLQEKDALWKECDELRYIQKLQEEGDGTEGKWMEDQEARYCLHCGTQFSFIIRKHHCRTCGKIFCNDCSKQWIIAKEDGKHERCCLSCLERIKTKNDIQALSSSITSPSATSTPIRGNRLSGRAEDEQFDTITDEEVRDTSESIYDQNGASSSIYATSEYKDEGESSMLSDDTLEKKTGSQESRDVIIPAGDTMRVPILINNPDTTLEWKFSTDRSIDFQLSYLKSENDEEQILISKCRCNSHSEPVEGEMLSKLAGIYTLEFDNKFSMFMSKELKYTLRVQK